MVNTLRYNSDFRVCIFNPDLTSDVRPVFNYLLDSSAYGHFIVHISNIEPTIISLPTPKIHFFSSFLP